MHRRLHRFNIAALAGVLGLLVLLAAGAPVAAAAEECAAEDETCAEHVAEAADACTCASEDVWPPPEPCEEAPADADDTRIPVLPQAPKDEVEVECPPPPEDAALPQLPEEKAPEVKTPAVPALPTPPPAPAQATPPAPTEPPIRSAAPQGSTPDQVQESTDGGGTGLSAPAPPAHSSRPSLQTQDFSAADDDAVSDAIEPSFAPEPEPELELEAQDLPEVALAEPDSEPVDEEELLAMAEPLGTLPVQQGDWQEATARMLGGMLVGFALGFGLLLWGLHLQRRGGLEPPRRPSSPLRLS